ncbi:MAG TPA: M15 family metallopeptidase [Ignavibacteriaceae bacterium]|nr:M15 family metallopeptidase [Ignavibacteriaceae bacterium]
MFKKLILLLILPVLLHAQNKPASSDIEQTDSGKNSSLQKIIIDSDISFNEALSELKIPANIKDQLVLETVNYYGLDDMLHQGQILVNKKIAEEVIQIFEFIKQIRFPIEKVIPLSKYNWSDSKSMEDNNTSSFNFRFVSGSRILSKHANGLAIDINPKLNPYVKKGKMIPANAVYDSTSVGTLTQNSELVKEFKRRGWSWGGDWKSLKDYQHFQKELEK